MQNFVPLILLAKFTIRMDKTCHQSLYNMASLHICTYGDDDVAILGLEWKLKTLLSILMNLVDCHYISL